MVETLKAMAGPALVRERKRTHLCGSLRKEHIGQEVVLMGWVQSQRDHGGAVFIDLRDRTGIAQVVFEGSSPEAHAIGDRLRSEYVVGVIGQVRSRGGNVNPKLPTGEIEVVVSYVEVLNRAETPPFLIEDQVDTAEEKRLKYRFLDLRRPELQRSLILRSKMNHRLMSEARLPRARRRQAYPRRPDFLVRPSKLGDFYAASPSCKQLFMIVTTGTFRRGASATRICADRQPEFTQRLRYPSHQVTCWR
jgi:aspartyl-tRNA synthetase